MKARQVSSSQVERSRQDLGRRLRSQRVMLGESVISIAEKAGMSASKLSRLELGRMPQSVSDVTKLVCVLSMAPEARKELINIATGIALGKPNFSDQRTALSSVPAQAISSLAKHANQIQTFSQTMVCAQLQTYEYMNALFDNFYKRPNNLLFDIPEKEDFIVGRMKRQTEIYDNRKTFQFILTEGAMRQRRVDEKYLTEQVRHILRIGELQNVEVLIIPLDNTVSVPMSADFTIYDQIYTVIDIHLQSVQLDEPATVVPYVSAFEALKDSALGRDDSLIFLEQFSHELIKK